MEPAPIDDAPGPAVRRALPRSDPETAAESLRRTVALANLLDQRFRIPGTPIRFGLDGLLGLIPGAGDAIGAALSIGLLWHARRLRVRKRTWVRMGANLLLDAVVGSVPVLGDAFDVWFKANLRNARLLEREVAGRAADPAGPRRRP